jgi:ABC-type polysaccharide/polyol phosphate export permease
MIKGRWREFCREPSALFFVVLMPLVWMTILGFAFSGSGQETYGVGMAEAPETPAPLAQDLRDRLAGDPRVRLRTGSPDEITQWLRRGEILLVVEPGSDSVRYIFDPQNRESTRARMVIDDLVQEAAGRTNPVLAIDEAVDIAGTRYIDFLIPGLIAFSIMTSSLYGTGMTVVSNRRESLLKRYLATPMNPLNYIVSHIVGRGFILAVELVTVLLAGWLMFDFVVSGRIGGLVAFAALGAAAFTAIAMLLGARTSNVAAMNGITNLIAIPMMIVGGVWFARSNFPDWIAEPVRLLPLTALVDGLRKIALEGLPLTAVGFEIVVLTVYLVACTLATKVLFKWY